MWLLISLSGLIFTHSVKVYFDIMFKLLARIATHQKESSLVIDEKYMYYLNYYIMNSFFYLITIQI